MKKYLIGIILILLVQYMSANHDRTTVSTSNNTLVPFLSKSLKMLWNKYSTQNEDTFVGRCFGIAKKIRQIIPVVIFMLGVIMTKLGFLTLFSLKSLALLGLLVVLNVSGAAAKLGAIFHHKKDEKHPQTVHFHIHQGKDSPYHIGHSSIGGWEDRLSGGNSREYDVSDSYNLYEKLLKDPQLVNVGRSDR